MAEQERREERKPGEEEKKARKLGVDHEAVGTEESFREDARREITNVPPGIPAKGTRRDQDKDEDDEEAR